jgi:hypothetical protein
MLLKKERRKKSNVFAKRKRMNFSDSMTASSVPPCGYIFGGKSGPFKFMT